MEGKSLFLKTVQGNTIKSLIEVMKDIWHDINFEFDSTGLKILTMDTLGLSVVHVKLKAETFEQYTCPEKLIIGVSLVEMYKLIKTTTSRDTLVLFVDQAEPNKLGITLENADENRKTCYKLKLLDIDHTEYKIPDIEFDSVITLPSIYFQRTCRDMSKLSNVVTIRTDDNTLVLSCEGEASNQETVIGETSEGMVMNIKSDKVFKGRFSLKYLVLFTKSSALCNTCILYLKEGLPMVLEYKIAGSAVRFLMAPMNEADTDDF